MEIYYKGEDISMTLGLFTDRKMTVPIKLSDYSIDLLLYNDGDTNEVYCTNDVDCSSGATKGDVCITSVDNYTFKVVIPFLLLDLLKTGQIVLEVRLTSKGENVKRIQKALPFILEDSRIKLK